MINFVCSSDWWRKWQDLTGVYTKHCNAATKQNAKSWLLLQETFNVNTCSLMRMLQSVMGCRCIPSYNIVYILSSYNYWFYWSIRTCTKADAKKYLKPSFRCGHTNMWKRIPHLMQQHGAERKGYKMNSVEHFQLYMQVTGTKSW